ncbi:MAG: hypothetical protein WKF77_23865 [Planctomycetaceae bacterium]
MPYPEDPRQSELFDVFADILAPVAYRRLTSGWQHVFRQAILKLMPAGKLAEHFDPEMGRPTKELYSMAGLCSSWSSATGLTRKPPMRTCSTSTRSMR